MLYLTTSLGLAAESEPLKPKYDAQVGAAAAQAATEPEQEKTEEAMPDGSAASEKKPGDFRSRIAAIQAAGQQEYIRKIRISWEPIPGAVSYQLAIMKADENIKENIVTVKKGIFTNGYELDTSMMPDVEGYYWKVAPLDISSQYMGLYSSLKPVREQEINPQQMKATTQFEEMAYAPLYPVYSWIPVKNAALYEIQIWRAKADLPEEYELIRQLQTQSADFYEYAGFTTPGSYYWRVRCKNARGGVLEDWSEPSYFQVKSPVKVAALGDSITHGGGAISTPPGYVMYDWEHYCQVPIKNLGYSGDTVEAMSGRFEQDVLPFAPKILVIMGGVNNYRNGDSSWYIIDGLQTIKEKCQQYGIIPVFVTGTPINPYLMAQLSFITPAYGGWQAVQHRVNEWIMQQPYHVDVNQQLTNEYGDLRDTVTTDGLHPDAPGKFIIGEAIGAYLLQHFPAYNLLEK